LVQHFSNGSGSGMPSPLIGVFYLGGTGILKNYGTSGNTIHQETHPYKPPYSEYFYR